MKIPYPDSSMIPRVLLAEVKLKKVPQIPEVAKVPAKACEEFPQGEKPEIPKLKKQTPKTPPNKVSPPHLGNTLDITAE